MEKRTLLGWLLDFLIFAAIWYLVIVIVRFLHGGDILAGGLGALTAARITDALFKNN